MPPTIDNYKAKALINPQGATKTKYLKMYSDYVTHYMTLADLGLKWGIADVSWVGKIIKWAVHYMHEHADKDLNRGMMEDRIINRLKDLQETYLEQADNTYKQAAILKEIRLNERLLAQIQSLIGRDGDKGAGQPVKVNVQINNLGHRTGVKGEVEDDV